VYLDLCASCFLLYYIISYHESGKVEGSILHACSKKLKTEAECMCCDQITLKNRLSWLNLTAPVDLAEVIG
jgi:hypothetical protein